MHCAACRKVFIINRTLSAATDATITNVLTQNDLDFEPVHQHLSEFKADQLMFWMIDIITNFNEKKTF